MSVFNDFQRLWMERFPQSSLSDAWEQDVRASLERHKQRIQQLSTELEQETLYVEYLERLLSDVEKYRKSGKDPSDLLEANATSGLGGQTPLHQQSHSDEEVNICSSSSGDLINEEAGEDAEKNDVRKQPRDNLKDNKDTQHSDRDQNQDQTEEYNSLVSNNGKCKIN